MDFLKKIHEKKETHTHNKSSIFTPHIMKLLQLLTNILCNNVAQRSDGRSLTLRYFTMDTYNQQHVVAATTLCLEWRAEYE